MKFVILFAILSVYFVLAEFVHRKFKTDEDIPRKIIHILSGVTIALLPPYFTKEEAVVLAILFAAGLIISKQFNLIRSIHAVSRKTLGEIYFPLSVGILAMLFLPNEPRLFQFGMLTLALPDAMAAFVGRSIGKRRINIFGHTKTWEGTTTFFTVSYLLFVFFLPMSAPTYLVLLVPAIILALLELILINGLDNLVLPIIAAYLLKILS